MYFPSFGENEMSEQWLSIEADLQEIRNEFIAWQDLLVDMFLFRVTELPRCAGLVRREAFTGASSDRCL